MVATINFQSDVFNLTTNNLTVQQIEVIEHESLDWHGLYYPVYVTFSTKIDWLDCWLNNVEIWIMLECPKLAREKIENKNIWNSTVFIFSILNFINIEVTNFGFPVTVLWIMYNRPLLCEMEKWRCLSTKQRIHNYDLLLSWKFLVINVSNF